MATGKQLKPHLQSSDGFINLRPLVGVMHISHQTPEGKEAYPTEIPQFGLGVFLMSDGGESGRAGRIVYFWLAHPNIKIECCSFGTRTFVH